MRFRVVGFEIWDLRSEISDLKNPKTKVPGTKGPRPKTQRPKAQDQKPMPTDPYLGFQVSQRAKEIYQRLHEFMEAHVYPNESLFRSQIESGDRWQPAQIT